MLSKLWAVCKSLSKLFFLKDACLQTPEADVYGATSIHKDLSSLRTNAPRASTKKIPQLRSALQVWDTRRTLQPSGHGSVSSPLKLLNAFVDTQKGRWCSHFAGQQPLCTPHRTQSPDSSLGRSWQVLQLLSLGLCFCWQGDTKCSAFPQGACKKPGWPSLSLGPPAAPAASQEPPNSHRQYLTITCKRPQLPPSFSAIASTCLSFSRHIFNFLCIWSLFLYTASGEWTWMVTSIWVFF